MAFLMTDLRECPQTDQVEALDPIIRHRIVSKFGELIKQMEKELLQNPVDAEVNLIRKEDPLPYPKATIRQALLEEMRLTRNQKRREALKNQYTSLAVFVTTAEYCAVGAFLEAITKALAEADDPCGAETRKRLEGLAEAQAFYVLQFEVGERSRAAEQELQRLGL